MNPALKKHLEDRLSALSDLNLAKLGVKVDSENRWNTADGELVKSEILKREKAYQISGEGK